MLEGRVSRALERVRRAVEGKDVKFSRPQLTPETSRNTPSKYAVGRLRDYGEWIQTFSSLKRDLDREKIEMRGFLETKTGRGFVKALSDRVYGLRGDQIYEVLLALSVNKVKVEALESALVRELEDSLEDLHTLQLLDLPLLLSYTDQRFLEKVKQVVRGRESENSDSEVYRRVMGKMEDEFDKKLNQS